MQQIRVRAHAKINLYLDVVGKRADGYHNLETIFHSIGLYDDVIIRRQETEGITVRCEHPRVPCDSRNLAYRAAQLLSNAAGGIGGIEIDIHKRIPVAAGLAGGSANAAAVLHGVNELFRLGFTKETLMQFGAQLGADVPFLPTRRCCLRTRHRRPINAPSRPFRCVAPPFKFRHRNFDCHCL